MSITVMKQALEALETCGEDEVGQGFNETEVKQAITSLRQAIAEAEKQDHEWLCGECIKCGASIEKREWVGLTPADFDKLEQLFGNKVSNDFVFADIVCVISAKLKEKNGF